jgi:hypothetical protein
MKKYYDQKVIEAPNFKEGDLVLLNGKNIRTKRPTKKFDHKMQGPFVIEKVLPSKMAYRLKLPKRWTIHNVFQVSLLEPYRQSDDPDRMQIDSEQVLEDAMDVDDPVGDVYEVESILSSMRDPDTGKVKYLVKWKGYEDESERTWEPWEHMVGAKDELLKFHKRDPDAPRDRRVRVKG